MGGGKLDGLARLDSVYDAYANSTIVSSSEVSVLGSRNRVDIGMPDGSHSVSHCNVHRKFIH